MEHCRETRHLLSSWLPGAGQGPAAAGLHSPPELPPQSRCPAEQVDERTCPYPHCPIAPGSEPTAHSQTDPSSNGMHKKYKLSSLSSLCCTKHMWYFFFPSILRRRVGFPRCFLRAFQQPGSVVDVRGNISLWDRSGIASTGTSGSTFLPLKVLSPRCPFLLTSNDVLCACAVHQVDLT